MMSKRMPSVLALLGVLSASSIVHAESQVSCVKADTKTVEQLFERWNDSLKSGSAKDVSSNYLSDAVLLPTLSNQARLTDAERKDYFIEFLKKGPVGKIDSRVIRTGCNKAIDTGTYTFTFKDGAKVSARYTFTYAWDGNKWLISSHHSSVMPE